MYNITVDEENRARGCNNLDIPLEELLAKPMTDQALWVHGDDDDGSGDDDDADHDNNDADGNNDRGDMFFFSGGQLRPQPLLTRRGNYKRNSTGSIKILRIF